MKIGIISDTHGLLRPEAISALSGSEVILHIGDVGKNQILERLSEIAPVHAIRGNIDTGPWADGLPETLELHLAGKDFYLLHDLKSLDFEPTEKGVNIVLSGHSHKPHHDVREGVIFLNPGAAGKRRFSLPITLARMEIQEDLVEVEIIDLFA